MKLLYVSYWLFIIYVDVCRHRSFIGLMSSESVCGIKIRRVAAAFEMFGPFALTLMYGPYI